MPRVPFSAGDDVFLMQFEILNFSVYLADGYYLYCPGTLIDESSAEVYVHANIPIDDSLHYNWKVQVGNCSM